MQIQKTLLLPCGARLQNRLAKSAMSENLSPRHHGPTEPLIRLYQRWARGGAGLIVTGNVMIDGRAIAEPGNVLVEDRSHFALLQTWAQTVAGTEVHLWPQLNHPGRQAVGALNREVVAPSAVRTRVRGMSALFAQPRALNDDEILELIERFGNTAEIMKDAGFTGVQIHAAHGYLISQFLSPLVNRRTDRWGGSLENRARFVVEVYREIRRRVGEAYPIGIKINSADFQRGGFTETESMEVVRMLNAEGMDLVEVSGGTYEAPAMTGSTRASTREREAYFMDYVERVRKILDVPLMLTGGFRTVAAMESALAAGHLDVIGLARPFSIYPDLARELLSGNRTELRVPNPKIGIERLDRSGFLDIKWHEVQLHRMARGKDPDPAMGPYPVLGHFASLMVKSLLP